MSSAIQKAEVVPLGQGQWARERIDLIKRTVCDPRISDSDFAVFIEQCKRSEMDPLLKEAFCIPRAGKWVFQPSESGMLGRAEGMPDFRGIQAAAVHEKDVCEVDSGAGTVTHKFNPAGDRGKLLGAWARVRRENRLDSVVWLDLAGYVQSSDNWRKIPATMIVKCARVAALRTAYPRVFGGLYIAEELPSGQTPEATPKPTAKELAAQKVQAIRKADPPAEGVPPHDVVTGEVIEPGVNDEPADGLPKVVPYGKNAGMPIRDLKDSQLEWYLKRAIEKGADGDDRDKPFAEALERELQRRGK